MQQFASEDTLAVSPETREPDDGFHTKVIDALFVSNRNVSGIGAQARDLGMSPPHWSRLRAGKVQPLHKTVLRIARHLGTTSGVIYGPQK